MTLAARCYAKINIGLAVYAPRPDGYHEVRTILQTISLADALRVRRARDLRIAVDPPVVPADETNLVLRAARALADATGVRQGAAFTLEKRVPHAAGLGGGSSDAAATLRLLCRLWNVRPPSHELHAIAASLGADVPFFLRGGTQLATGRGDDLHRLAPESGWWCVVVVPPFGVSTLDAYASVKWGLTPLDALPSMPQPPGVRHELAQLTGKTRPKALYNSFEATVFAASPVLAEVKERLLALGAFGAALSGSGSAVFGLARSVDDARRIGAGCGGLGMSVHVAHPVRTGSRITVVEDGR